jgi:hypothetical protein
MSGLPVVTFVTRAASDRWRDIDSLEVPDRFPERIRSGVDVWIVSSFLELRARAARLPFRVELSDAFPPGGAVVAHRDDLRLGRGYSKSYVAAVRADRPHIHLAPWQIVQNPTQQAERAVLIPSWPQPGLVPRDPNRRGLSVLGYFGRASSLPGFFGDPAFRAELERRAIAFRFDERDWRDYSAVDVCMGLRYEPEIGLATKPFAKLVNAWLAGVPALLGAEPAYRALRRSALDYLEVNSARELLAALDRLRGDPALYAAMVENGRRRSGEFTREAVTARWCEFLDERFLPAWRGWTPAGLLKTAGCAMRQWRETRRYKKLEASQLAALRTAKTGERL